MNTKLDIPQGPDLLCRPLPNFRRDDWEAVEKVFAHMDSCRLRQAWRDEPEANFQPAEVRIGWRDEALWVYATLHDLDIFNKATQFNDATYSLGDIFEIFVRPAPQSTYYEFHITPDNQLLQLRWPDAAAVTQFDVEPPHESLSSYFVRHRLLDSQVRVEAAQNRWYVLAAVPAAVAESEAIQAGDEWAFSFGRYDCTHGIPDPVWSSSSPHPMPSFHRQSEWGRLTFVTE